MSSTRMSPRWPTPGSSLLLILASRAIASYGYTFTVNAGDKIQDALDQVQPGDTIEIESGEYYEDIITTVDGTADERITIRAAGGPENKENVILRGAGDDRVFEVNHDYYTIESFTIDGRNKEEEEANDDNEQDAYRDKLLYVVGNVERTTRDGGYLSALDGLVVHDMILKNAGGECIRLKYFVTYAEIYENYLESCGVYDFPSQETGKNGEGIYIGTAIDQWGDEVPTDEPDGCMGNRISGNIIKTQGNEGVEVKEGGIDNVIEDNKIYMQLDVDAGGIASRGDGTIIRNNLIVDAEGAGVRLGGGEVDGYQYGVNNQVYGNTIEDCRAYGVKIMASPQGQICDNDIELPEGVDDDDYAYSGGEYGDAYDPRAKCDNPGPSPTPPTPSPTSPAPSSTPPTPSPYRPTPSPTDLTPSSTPSTLSPTPLTPSPTPRTLSPTSPTSSPSSPTPSPSALPSPPTPPTPSPTPSTPSPPSPTPSPIPLTPSPASPTPSPKSPTPSPSTSSPTPSTSSPTSPTPSPATPTPTIHTPPPVEDAETDAEYVGCFADYPESHSVNFSYRDSEDMTNENCIEHCRDKGSRYAGTSKGDVCGCAYSTEKISRNGESTRCHMPCSGDESELCGGHRAVSTWKL